ncbi:MAG: GTPase ObgE [Candidatus Poribacteria bacterium]|nr:GTPase ObgE [Candidatus Poribacteria bacterium]
MLDRAIVRVKAGDGGNGCVSFRREKHVPRGGPDGGNGGRGGDIIFVASESVSTLLDQHYSQQYAAERGEHGTGKQADGKHGGDLRVIVPVGTSLFDLDEDALIADLNTAGMEVIVARGGIGGRGNASFKSSSYRTPRIAENGEPGVERAIQLEVRLIADVGLVGFPNAGKSTILSSVSDAKPKIANYPFTTLEPNLGVVRVEAEKNFVVADLPGLIEGAHEGAGLGHDFLRHVERTRLLLHVIDAAGVDGRDPWDDFRVINRELRLHSPELAQLPQLIVLNKIDLPEAQTHLPELRKRLAGAPVFTVSGATGEGLRELMFNAYTALEELKAEEASKRAYEPETEVIEYVAKRGIQIVRDGDAFRVESDAVRRAVVMTNFENDEAVWHLHRRLDRMGLIKALRKVKAKDGDTIVIGDVELEFNSADSPKTFTEYLAQRRPKARRQSRDEYVDEGNAPA